MKYAVNEEGIEAMNTMASAITESVEELEGYTTTVQSAADEYEDMATTSICFARAPVNLFEDSAIAFCKKMGYSERQVIMKKRIKPLKEATAEASNSSPNGCDECGL